MNPTRRFTCPSLVDDNEEIALKNTNAFNEQYNIWTSSGYTRRAYITTCFPARF